MAKVNTNLLLNSINGDLSLENHPSFFFQILMTAHLILVKMEVPVTIVLHLMSVFAIMAIVDIIVKSVS